MSDIDFDDIGYYNEENDQYADYEPGNSADDDSEQLEADAALGEDFWYSDDDDEGFTDDDSLDPYGLDDDDDCTMANLFVRCAAEPPEIRCPGTALPHAPPLCCTLTSAVPRRAR